MSCDPPLLELTLQSVRAALPGIRDRVRALTKAERFGVEACGQIVLAVDEALANVIQHGYEGVSDQPIDVRFERLERLEHNGRRGLRVTIRDYGRQVDPATIRSRDLSDIRPGGLGVHIMRSVMDEVIYARPADCGMLLTMTKWHSEPDAPVEAE